MNARIVVLGFEAADPDLIEQWCAGGHLPNLAALRERWPWMRIHSSTTLSSGTTWPSVFSGTSPAKHGTAFYHAQFHSGTYRIDKRYADQVKREPFWNALSEAGVRSAIFDVPATRPLPGFNGIHIGGFGVEAPNWGRRPWPEDLVREIKRHFGPHPLERWYQVRPQAPAGWCELQDKLLSGMRLKTSIAKHLMQREPWELFFCVYSEPHWSGHLFWHIRDPDHPEHPPEVARLCGDTMLEVYQAMDQAVGELTGDLEETTLFLFSNTGMGPNYNGIHLLPEVLKRLGMAGAARKGGTGDDASAGKGAGHAIGIIEAIIPPGLINRLKYLVPERSWDSLVRRILHSGTGWRHSRAFSVPNDYSGAIRINLQGREPHGRVAPGPEYDALCAELAGELTALVNCDTGRPAVRRVIRVDQWFQGENLDELPDLIVEWTGDAPIRALSSPRIGTVRGVLADKRTGAHRPDGFLLAAGKHIRQDAGLERGSILDIAPTLLYLMGQPVARDMDGTVWLDLLDESFVAENPVRHR